MPRSSLVLAVLAALFLTNGGAARGNAEPPRPLDNPDVALYLQPQLEQAMLADTNAERRAHGLPALTADPELQTIARAYARRMLEQHFIGHVDSKGGSPADRLNQARYAFHHAAENLIYTTGDEAEAFAALRASPGHRANILAKPVTRIGVGAISSSVYSTMYVEEFAGD
ncbi:MAG: CAP domain-containing protein [Candidatus Eremiobacteraeota bacterium]|nr:CAP domain-containing protein [Candidatus Eremiobacteraeota bacterium]